MHPRQVHGAPGRPEERDGGGAQHGPRHGGQVRVSGRLHAKRPQHNTMFLRQLDRHDTLVQRRYVIIIARKHLT